MKHRFAFVVLVVAFSAPLVHATEERESPSSRSTDSPIAEAPAVSRCSSLFQILDTNEDHFIDKEEAKKSAETTALWKSFDRDLDHRLSLAEFCAGMK